MPKFLTLAILVLTVCGMAMPPRHRSHRPATPRKEHATAAWTVWTSRTVTLTGRGTGCKVIQGVTATAAGDGTITVRVRCLF